MAWLTTAEALARLGTKPQTLYANVSRGRLRARPDPEDPRRSLYAAEDVERLAARRGGRRSAETVAAETIRWGDPVLPSAISAIAGGRLYYRGRDAVALAETEALETVAALLWQAEAPAREGAGGAPAATPSPAPGAPLLPAFSLLAERAARDLPSHGRGAAVLRREAGGLVAALAGALFGPADGALPLHRRVAGAWGRPRAAEPVRRALVLLADHELNASTFATRVAVSTGASLAAGLLAGLATLSGPLHGAASAGVQALAESAARHGAEAAVRACLAEGRSLPAFGHRLYPDGDCRAAALLEGLELPPVYTELRAAAEAATGEAPNVDFALAALARSFALPAEAPLLLFALARSVGWLAHALEQAETGELIRPRAHYVGPPIQPSAEPAATPR